MGWFLMFSRTQIHYSEFSSPLGDGLVRYVAFANDSSGKFSSPSGDGLVQKKPILSQNANYFRPRVGMGWFGEAQEKMAILHLFSSPSGDGLVR